MTLAAYVSLVVGGVGSALCWLYALIAHDARGFAAGGGMVLGAVLGWLLMRMWGWMCDADQPDPFTDTPGLLDSRTRRERLAALDREFHQLDQTLRHPAQLRRRLTGIRARHRDQCDPGVRERVAWIGLWQQLESDEADEGARDDNG